jgi:hypothetical protein
MKGARLAGLIVVTALALGLITTSTALALPEFSTTKVTFSATSGISTLVGNNGTETITCTKDTVSASEIATKFLVGPFDLHFFGCKSTGAGGSGCSIKSVGASAEGLILTNPLHAFLVLQRLSTGAHVTWLIALPIGGNIFVTLASNKCTKETKVTGQVGGEITPLKSKQTTSKVIFTAAGQNLAVGEEFEGGEVGTHEYRGLTAFTTAATEETEESVTFSKAVEVT